jgi:purine nucleosidase
VFWDPWAADWVLRNTDFPLIVFPLDVTNQAAITDSFKSRLLLQGKRFRYSNLAYQSYELVDNESFYDMWDVVTTCYIPHPEFFAEPERTRLAVVTDGDQQGMLHRSEDGRPAQVVLDLANPDAFYDYVLRQLAR